ncbi:competence damage-inducible protein A [Gottschalkia acidurici 9a]|uniref:Putative competence-damage inducible protein n=1 Tax=Gottschalkia acidurici (strain ATCC 7906 / DSM 604 / BCRC 14475 / CIP 104303 / KCTC 5404 / NCIMB 10678 / 9a) TaxID=1128398 RepID=K0B1I7_GOTA9|nr:competence/damage-inducible protein A [Gottschalkia acidurici]AFS78551.1 competence damage-inducible protein A [Gottschalkia acidurici 9a]
MNAEIINVGDELLAGKTLNSNSKFLSEELTVLGIETRFCTMIRDNKEDIEFATELALKRSDVIIYTGGLGPTEDDFTKEVVCNTIGRELILDKEVLSSISSFFEKRNINMTKNNVKQAYVPNNSIVLENSKGTAPGFFIKEDKRVIILLPGPPREVNNMFKQNVVPLLWDLSNIKIKTRTINTIGIGESQLEEEIKDIISNYKNPYIATYARDGQVDIRITIKYKNEQKANLLLREVEKKIHKKIKKYIYSFNNEKIEETVFKLLNEKNFKIGFCESCTGGLVSSRLTKISGASNVLDRSIITYSNRAKIEEVGVKKETLDLFGAVSEETSIEMAKGLLKKEI